MPPESLWEQEVAISVIVPTRNEAENVEILGRRLADCLARSDLSWELIFVDDSDDETPHRIGALRMCDVQVSLIHRPPNERNGGLAGAVVEGFSLARGRVLVVMDGDLQHPPEIVPGLASSVLEGQCSIAVGSRYITSKSEVGLSGPLRHAISQASRFLTRMLFPSIWTIQDPLSGLFALKRSVIEDTLLAPDGFKILLEVLVRGHWDQVVEVPYVFASRGSGGSKANWSEGIRFLQHIARLRLLKSMDTLSQSP